MRGHSTDQEQRQLAELEGHLDFNKSSIEELLTLGLLYIEPAHEEENAIRCFEATLEREPDCALARIWLAYCLQHCGMDRESLRKALAVLLPLHAEDSPERGAALMLSVLIARDQGVINLESSVAMMEESVSSEPRWVSNRQLLAELYRRCSRKEEAIEQIRLALLNVMSPNSSWSILHKNYETFITWRAAHRNAERLEQELQSLLTHSYSPSGPEN